MKTSYHYLPEIVLIVHEGVPFFAAQKYSVYLLKIVTGNKND